MHLVDQYLHSAKKLKKAIHGPTSPMLDDAAISDYMEHLWEQMNDEERQEVLQSGQLGNHLSALTYRGFN